MTVEIRKLIQRWFAAAEALRSEAWIVRADGQEIYRSWDEARAQVVAAWARYHSRVGYGALAGKVITVVPSEMKLLRMMRIVWFAVLSAVVGFGAIYCVAFYGHRAGWW